MLGGARPPARADSQRLQAIEQTPGSSYPLYVWFAASEKRPAWTNLPVTGEAVPELAAVDDFMLAYLRQRETEAATIAITRNGRLVFRRGYGWQDRERTEPIRPDAQMRIASDTKPVTAAAVRQLIQDGLLAEDTRAFERLAIPPPPGQPVADPRIYDITVAQLLEHRSGLVKDRPRTEDIGQALGLGRAANLTEIISYLLTQPLASEPGTQQLYSNNGYVVLGALIEAVSGLGYEDYIRTRVAEPLGANALRLADDFHVHQRRPHSAMVRATVGRSSRTAFLPHPLRAVIFVVKTLCRFPIDRDLASLGSLRLLSLLFLALILHGAFWIYLHLVFRLDSKTWR